MNKLRWHWFTPKKLLQISINGMKTDSTVDNVKTDIFLKLKNLCSVNSKYKSMAHSCGPTEHKLNWIHDNNKKC